MMCWDSQYLENSGSTAGNIGFWKLLSFFLCLRLLDGVAELKCQVLGLFCLVSKDSPAGRAQGAPGQEPHCLAWERTAVSRAAAGVCHRRVRLKEGRSGLSATRLPLRTQTWLISLILSHWGLFLMTVKWRNITRSCWVER